ncbi:protease modulator HflC [Allohahella sp. A8]|uniref:protease modulator HflC n=1 Tax=Allohahella sp. A8 TaxID=3141461 RepID=UPI000C08E82F|nr:HflC protein [Hahellaceae bacterium]|tara:strand:- start:62341 stop:63234 length:894 start_codon:yes stop_codon:yes gene_type:complete
MSGARLILIGLVLLALLILAQAAYIVPETHRAVVLRFGGIIKTDVPAGLHFKIPFVDENRNFDTRVLAMDLPVKSYLTVEQKPLDVNSYATWRIVNVGQFYRAAQGSEDRARTLLISRIDKGLRDQFGKRTMHEVVAGEREELMEELTASVDREAADKYGINVIDIRVRAIDLPKRVSDSVYERMESERLKIAQSHRSKGEELAEGVRADADRQRTVELAKAFEQAEQLRGEGEAEAARLYAEAFGKNEEFYAFYRRLKAYETSLATKDNIMVLEPDSEFFKYMKQSEPTARTPEVN